MSKVLYLVACVGSKQDQPAAARALYQSVWFTKARAYVESQRARWFILSAKHGLTDPHTVIAPYEQTLNTMSASARRDWAAMVERQLVEGGIEADRIIVLAGRHYRQHLVPGLHRITNQVEVPMERLGIGKQLQWLSNR